MGAFIDMWRIAALLLMADVLNAAQWVVAPDGTADGSGTVASPLSFVKAIGDGVASPVSAGDTIYMRGGTYYSRDGSLGVQFTSSISGTAGSPITIRPYNSELPIIEATATNITGLKIDGDYTRWYGLEIWNSSTDRVCPIRLNAVDIHGVGTKLINCIVHDSGSGVGCWTDATPSEVYGCLIYNVGYDIPDARGHGHGIYTHASEGGHLIRENVVLYSFSIGVQAYTEVGDPYLRDFLFNGNVSVNSGSTTSTGIKAANYGLGGSSVVMSNLTFIGNLGYQASGFADNAAIGYLTYENANAVVASNYFGKGGLTINHWTNLTVTANTIANPSTYFQYVPSAGAAPMTWDGNFYQTTLGTPFKLSTTAYSFANWTNATGFDVNSTKSGAATSTVVFVRTNAYQVGRANITVYNWANSDNVDVDVSSVVGTGWNYTVRNAADWFGPVTKSGTYAGGTISLPMTNLTVATPVGLSAPAATGPAFNVFVLQSSPAPTSTVNRLVIRGHP